MMKTKKRKELSRGLVTRLCVGVLLLAIMGCALTSCMTSGAAIKTVSKNHEITVSDDNGLSADKLNALAETIVENKQAAAIREQLVAALNGYDMTAADFDDSKVPLPGETMEGAIEAHPENAAIYALNVLKKAGIETFSYYDTDNQPIMTVADVQSLVKCFQSNVNVEAKHGIFTQIFIWVGMAFAWLIEVPGFGSFILGTVYFAILVEILMLPLGINQQRNSRKQARLRPKEMAIRNKYKGRNDQQTMQKVNQEIQDLYAKEGYSPMAGCLPLLISMIFLLPLYYVVIDPMKFLMGASDDLSSVLLTFAGASRASGGLGLTMNSNRGTIEVLSLIREGGLSLDSLSDFAFFSNSAECMTALEGVVEKIPDFTLFGLNLGLTPSFGEPWILLIIPVLTFFAYWGTSKLNRKFTFQPTQNSNDPAQGCSNGMMDIMMPAMSTFFTFMVPAAVGLYWIFKSILGLGKQFVLSKVMPLPTFTEEEYKAAERELAGKDKNKPVKRSGNAPRNPNVRSLHHIDDEDYESPAEREARLAARKAEYTEPDEPAESPKTAEGTYGEGVSLKEDRPAKPKKKKGNKKAAVAEDAPADTDDD